MKLSHYWVVLFSLLVSIVAIFVAQRVAWRFDVLLDRPNPRSLHSRPIPRIGGVCVWVAVFVVLAWTENARAVNPMLPMALLIVAGISLLDDWRAQPVLLRLSAHLLAAMLAAHVLFPGEWMWIFPISLGLTWAGNLFNFMDGSDGLAGSMAMIGFGTLGVIAASAHHQIAILALTIAAAAAGFMLFNLPPARVFLGDTGSVPLGFAAAALSIWGARDGVWHWLLPVLVFLPFLLDASWTLAARVCRGERFWQAHRQHLYQRLILAGWSHPRLLAAADAVMCCAAFSALITSSLPAAVQGIVLTFACLCLTTLYAIAQTRLARHAD